MVKKEKNQKKNSILKLLKNKIKLGREEQI